MTPPVVTPRRARLVLAVAVASAGAVLAAGCGEDGGAEAGGPTPASDADLTVEAHDIDFDSDEYTVAPGEQRVAYVQEGALRHTLLVETADGAAVEGFELEVDGSPSDVGTAELDAGTYTLYCDVPGHREAGMEAELVVD